MRQIAVTFASILVVVFFCLYFVGIFIQTTRILPFSYFFEFIPDYFLVLLLLPILCTKFRFKFWLVTFLFLVILNASPFRISFNEVKKNESDPSTINIASFNTAQRIDGKELYRWFLERELDILFVQESKDSLFDDSSKIGLFSTCKHRLCVLSRHPIESLESLDRRPLGGWGSFSAAHSVNIRGHRVLIVNTHFSSISNFGYEFSSLKGLFAKIGLFVDQKDVEFALVNAMVDRLEYYGKVIIAGDFNITDRNPQYKKHWGHFVNLFSEVGTGYGVTRKSRLLFPRIDHILLGDAFEPHSVFIDSDMGSDHFPLVGTLELTIR
ncbi:endonuclease/exonuclease/phosphatase family protein [Alteromonas macleodii]